MIDWLLSWITPLNVTIYIILSVLPYIFLFKNKGKFVGTPELNEQYYPFSRLDLHKWSFIRFVLIMIFTGGIIRFCIGWSCVLGGFIAISLLKLGSKEGDQMSPFVQFIIDKMMIY